MDLISIISRTCGGFAVKAATVGAAIWIASYAVIALADAVARVSEALPK